MMEVHDFIKKFCDKSILYGEIVNIGNSFFLADKNLMEIKNRIKISPEAIGVFLGEMKNREFRPSAPLLDMIAKNSDKKLVVNRKTEWLFLCGRDIFGKGIVKANVKKPNELVFYLAAAKGARTLPRVLVSVNKGLDGGDIRR